MTEWEQITHSSQPEVFFGLPRGDSIVMAMSLTNICFGLIESGLIVKETPAAGIITQYESYSHAFLNMVSQSMAIHFAAPVSQRHSQG